MYYGIVAKNGFGVFDKKERMDKSAEYLYKPSIKQFDDLYNAFIWTVDNYNQFQTDTDDSVNYSFYGSLSDIDINWIKFRKQIYADNLKVYI